MPGRGSPGARASATDRASAVIAVSPRPCSTETARSTASPSATVDRPAACRRLYDDGGGRGSAWTSAANSVAVAHLSEYAVTVNRVASLRRWRELSGKLRQVAPFPNSGVRQAPDGTAGLRAGDTPGGWLTRFTWRGPPATAVH